MLNKLIKTIVLVLLLAGGYLQAAANNTASAAKDTIYDPLLDIRVKQETLFDSWRLWYNYNYIYEDVDSVTIKDSANFVLRTDSGRYLIKMRAMEQIQDEDYKATVYSDDSLIYIERPGPAAKALFQLDLFDTTLHMHHIQSMTMTDTSNNKKYTFLFRPESPYIDYIIDDPNNRPLSLTFRMKKEIVPADSMSYVPTRFIRISLTWTGLSTASDAPDSYWHLSTSKYFTRRNGVFVLTPAYANFKIIDATQQ